MDKPIPAPPAPPPKRVIREGSPWEGKRQADLPPAPHIPASEPFRGYTEEGVQQMARIGYLAGGALLGFLIGLVAGVSGGSQ